VRDSWPRLSGASEPAKYDTLVERVPNLWWGDAGPFVGLHELNAVRIEYFRAVLGGFGGRRVLDIGCGGGLLAEALAREGALVTGIDPSEKTIAVAREHAARSKLLIDYRVAKAETVDHTVFPTPFDLVFAVDVLEHVEDLDRSLGAIGGLLAPGGALGFLTHNRTLAAFLQLIWDEEYVRHSMPEGFHDFRRFITPLELTEKLARCGMVVQDIKGIARAGGRRVVVDDTTVTYIGWALRTR
jgi:2-polyprenyl-6-hydroxyphenyl methylase/3-demethylubiquinone-9 3-methyltransferase